MIAIYKIYLSPLDFFSGAFALKVKVELDLLKLELLLSASKDLRNQDLSSTREGNQSL